MKKIAILSLFILATACGKDSSSDNPGVQTPQPEETLPVPPESPEPSQTPENKEQKVDKNLVTLSIQTNLVSSEGIKFIITDASNRETSKKVMNLKKINDKYFLNQADDARTPLISFNVTKFFAFNYVSIKALSPENSLYLHAFFNKTAPFKDLKPATDIPAIEFESVASLESEFNCQASYPKEGHFAFEVYGFEKSEKFQEKFELVAPQNNVQLTLPEFEVTPITMCVSTFFSILQDTRG